MQKETNLTEFSPSEELFINGTDSLQNNKKRFFMDSLLMLFYFLYSVLAIEEHYLSQVHSVIPANKSSQKQHSKEIKNSIADNKVKVKRNGSKEQEKYKALQQTPSRLLPSCEDGYYREETTCERIFYSIIL